MSISKFSNNKRLQTMTHLHSIQFNPFSFHNTLIKDSCKISHAIWIGLIFHENMAALWPSRLPATRKYTWADIRTRTPVPGITTDNFQLNTRIDVPSLLGTVSVSKSVILGIVESQCGMVLLSRDVCDVEMFTFSPPDKYAWPLSELGPLPISRYTSGCQFCHLISDREILR